MASQPVKENTMKTAKTIQIMKCLQYLDSVCNGAADNDHKGFNKYDAPLLKDLAKYHTLTDKQESKALEKLQKYRGQLEAAGYELPCVQSTHTEEEPVREEQSFNETTEPAAKSQAVEDLRNGGTLSQSLPGYQERGPQIEMARLVGQAIQEERHAVIEAATGTGKSLAYLIPIVRSGKKAIISTANKALQDQLFKKDVPFLQKHLQPFGAALVKGMGNYVCLDRMEKEQREGLSYWTKDEALPKVEQAIEDSSFNGDFESLPFQVPGELKSKINGDPDECARRKCPLYGQCYYYKMREQAKHAQVVITNHSMLMLNTASQGKLLPEHDVVVVDEAHVLEGVAADAFTIEIRPGRVFSLLSLKKIQQFCPKEQLDNANRYAVKLWEELSERMPEDRNKSKIALTERVEVGLKLAGALRLMANTLRIKKPANTSDKEDALYDRLIERVEKLSAELSLAFLVDNKDYVYYLERVQLKNTETISVFMTPLTVASLLKESLFQDEKVILTSATLATPGKDGQPDFAFFKQQIGLDNAIEEILPLVFDYRKNAVLYLPDDMPAPAWEGAERKVYEAAMASKMLNLVETSEGRAFLLFSNGKMLDTVLRMIRSKLTRDGFTLLVQGEMPTGEMIRRFKVAERAVLFGLKTFWEGVDVSGEKLSLVVIDKPPFPPMDDPVVSAKMAYIERIHGHKTSFNLYSLPNATLALKQGVGRLIRSDSDTGVMAILDSRMGQGYGTRILRCLPPAQQVAKISDVKSFFDGTRIVQGDLFAGPVVEEKPQYVETRVSLTQEQMSRLNGQDLSELMRKLLNAHLGIE
jgi:Rad3-related DNA helicase